KQYSSSSSSLFTNCMIIRNEHISTSFCFFYNNTATTEFYTLSLHDALPILTERAYALSVTPLAMPLVASFARRRSARRSTRPGRDRKSTRLNSSHVAISYAVFCLKKKTGSLNVASVSLILCYLRDSARILSS